MEFGNSIQLENCKIVKNPSLLRDDDIIVVTRHPDLKGCAAVAEVLGYNGTTREVDADHPYWITLHVAVMRVLYPEVLVTNWINPYKGTLCEIVRTVFTPNIGMKVLLLHEFWNEYQVGLPPDCQPSYSSRFQQPPQILSFYCGVIPA
jgi:hypothetical protein